MILINNKYVHTFVFASEITDNSESINIVIRKSIHYYLCSYRGMEARRAVLRSSVVNIIVNFVILIITTIISVAIIIIIVVGLLVLLVHGLHTK